MLMLMTTAQARDAPAWDTSSHMEFSILMNRRLFTSDDSWNSFLATSRTQVVALVRALHSSFTPASVEFYAWVKLDSTSHKVTFRAPSAHRDLLLSASGVQVPFIINVVCRDDSARSRRDVTTSVVWFGKLNFPDSLALVKQVDSHVGLVLSKHSLDERKTTIFPTVVQFPGKAQAFAVYIYIYIYICAKVSITDVCSVRQISENITPQ